LFLLNLAGANWAVTGDAERTKDKEKDRKLGTGVLGAQVETHNHHFIFSLLFSSFTLFLFFIYIL
jgi:hypothetical protein